MAFKTCAGLLATALGLLGVQTAMAQTPPTAFPGDWPNLGAFNNRQGQNGDAKAFGSGRTNLRWVVPSTYEERAVLSLDNTDLAANFPIYGPPLNNAGSVAFTTDTDPGDPFVPNRLDWTVPATELKAAESPFLLPRNRLTGGGTRPEPYRFAFCTPGARGTADPTLAQRPNDRRFFDWRFTPPAGPDRNYAIFTYLPIGATDTSLGAATNRNQRFFPQRFFVYRIYFGLDANADGLGDQFYTDVVDTNVTGGGFVRLGNGGFATQAVFPFRTIGGIAYPITVRLFNTVPRFDDGTLSITGSFRGQNDVSENALARTRLVYADAVQARPTPGSFTASPTTATLVGGTQDLGLDWRVTVASNDYVTGTANGAYRQSLEGTVVSYQANPALWPITDKTTPLEKWRYSVVADSAGGNTTDNGSAAVVSSGAWTVRNDTTNPNHIGDNFLDALIVVDAPGTPPVVPPKDTVQYSPVLDDGDYAVYAYLGGSNGGAQNYGREVEYQIYQGATLVDTLSINQDVTSARWVRLGSQRYTNVKDNQDATASAPLKVVVTNYSTNAADAGRKSYADAVRFVGADDTGVTSTPVHANVNITGVGQRNVVIVADESGKVHCLDLVGKGDGTTTEYWTWPSTPRLNDPNWADPNLVEGIDGTINPLVIPPRDNAPKATLPTSFDLSTAAIANNVQVTPGVFRDLLYIAATNGRVYCLDMAGRGDFDSPNRLPGTTSRRWTFPDDYNPAAPDAPIGASNLGTFRGSVTFGDTAQGAPGPTVFVAAPQGRVYALDARGATATRSTTPRWRYPALNLPTTPPIAMTPTLFRDALGNGSLNFGTLRDPRNDGFGRLYSLDASNGEIVWGYNVPKNPLDLQDTVATIHRVDNSMGAFVTGMVAVLGGILDVDKSAAAPNHDDTLYALNNSLILHAFVSGTGLPVTVLGRTLRTTDLRVLSTGNLVYTVTSAYGRTGILGLYPTIAVTGSDGRLRQAFARAEDYNNFDGYLASGKNFKAPITSAAASNTTLFTGDNEGSLYALDDRGELGGNLSTNPFFDPGVGDVIPPNDPAGAAYRNLKIRLVNKRGFALLREVDVNGQGSLDYYQATTDPQYQGPVASPGNPLAFEWGETAYVLVYGFPYDAAKTNTNGDAVPPPQINLTLGLEGRTVRQLQVDSRQFKTPPVPPNVDGTMVVADGYAVVPFVFQNSGASALPPGSGTITATITTAATGNSSRQAEIAADTRPGAGAAVDFRVANPLSITVQDTPDIASPRYAIGFTTIANDAANLVNGSPDIADTATILENQLLASAGFGSHGGFSTAKFFVTDRSLMVLIRPEGLTNIRLQRTNLERQGESLGIFQALPSGLYPGFEDRPVERPNKSLDYPNIGREQTRAIKDPSGNAENPLLTPVTLRSPLALDGSPLDDVNLGAGNARTLVPTPFDLTIDVPRYQPAVNTDALTFETDANPADDPSDLLHLRHNANPNGPTLPQGYFGRVQVFVDASPDNRLNLSTSPEPFRAFNYTVGVLPQTSIQVGTPTVDLGSLAAGTGYATQNPFAAGLGGPFNPWTGLWGDVYKPISVRNDGNVNLTNLRLAKAVNETPTSGTPNLSNNKPWAIPSTDNDPLAWLSAVLRLADGTLQPGDLWSNVDTTFAAVNRHGGGNLVILPKPRVTDRVPTELVANPYPRANPNITVNANGDVVNPGTAGSALVDGSSKYRINLVYLPSSPKVGTSVPMGFPVGNYSTQLRIVENSLNLGGLDNDILQLNAGVYEAYSDPITLTFKVRETRMTNRPTPRTAPVLDDANLLPPGTTVGPDQNPGKASFRNAAPAAMRDINGSLIVAWESDRVGSNGTGVLPNAVNPSLLYLGSLDNAATFTTSGAGAPLGNAPLWDLSQFRAASNGQWFNKRPNGYPAGGANYFEGGAANVVASTMRFGSPSFPARGSMNPLAQGPTAAGNDLGAAIMGFVGEAQVSTGTGRISQSRVFVATVAAGADGVLADPGNPIPTNSDSQTAKGKPSVLQLTTGALVFYSETSAGQSSITMDRLLSTGNGFAPPVALDFGDGFSSVFSPSAGARIYRGTTTAADGAAPVVDLSFAGKLRGRPNAEVYLGRLRLARPITTDPADARYAATDPTAFHLVDGQGRTAEYDRAGSPFVLLPRQSLERIIDDGNGVYRARGVAWNRLAGVDLFQYVNGVATPLLIVNTRTVERQSGLIAYDSRLGGKVYLDPELGTVKFVGATPASGGELRLSYTPTFLRVTPGGTAAYSSVNGLFDDRYVSEYDYWFRNSGANYSGSFGDAGPTNGIRNDRYFFAYGRGAAGGGLTARPYSTTMRLGVRLPTRIATDGDGRVVGIQVTGNTRPYQVDPANGRVYFQSEDEDRPVVISYVGVNEATRATPTINVPAVRPSFVLERTESILPVDEAANDSSLTAFLDPFTYVSAATDAKERPPLVWLFYVSTRAGGPDVYFQTIAPRFMPFAK